MTTTTTRPTTAGTSTSRTIGTPRIQTKGNVLVSWLTTTDHKKIGYLYLITSFIYFCLGGVMALVMRTQLFEPGLQILQTKEQYNQLKLEVPSDISCASSSSPASRSCRRASSTTSCSPCTARSCC